MCYDQLFSVWDKVHVKQWDNYILNFKNIKACECARGCAKSKQTLRLISNLAGFIGLQKS